MKPINEPHKPHCGYLCSGTPPEKPCDCGAVTLPRLELSLGERSVELLAKGLARLDADDQREAKSLGLIEALVLPPTTPHDFVPGEIVNRGDVPTDSPMSPCAICGVWRRAHKTRVAMRDSGIEEVESRLRGLLAKQNLTSKPGDEHPLPFSDVLMVIRKALSTDMTPEPNEKPEDAQLGIGCFGRFDDTRGLRHVVALAVADANWVTVGIGRSATRWAEPESAWPGELRMSSNRWSEHRKRYLAWVGTKADDRFSFPRVDVVAFMASQVATA